MKITNISVILGLGLGIVQSEAVILWSESFETDGQGTRYTALDPFNDGLHDHWNRTDGGNIGNVSGSYSGFDGTHYWAAEDTDDNGGNGSDEQVLTFNPINVTGETSLFFEGLFAAGNEGASYDSTDYIQLQYRFDGGDFTTGLGFESVLSGSNSQLALDSDLNGFGDAPLLGNLMQSFSVNIPLPDGGADTLQFKLLTHMDAAGEEIAFDRFRLLDLIAVPEPKEYALTAGLGLLVFAWGRRRLARKAVS